MRSKSGTLSDRYVVNAMHPQNRKQIFCAIHSTHFNTVSSWFHIFERIASKERMNTIWIMKNDWTWNKHMDRAICVCLCEFTCINGLLFCAWSSSFLSLACNISCGAFEQCAYTASTVLFRLTLALCPRIMSLFYRIEFSWTVPLNKQVSKLSCNFSSILTKQYLCLQLRVDNAYLSRCENGEKC